MIISEMCHRVATSTSSGHLQAKFGNEDGLFLGLICFDYSKQDDFVVELIDSLNQWVESTLQRVTALRLIFAVELDHTGHQMVPLKVAKDGNIVPLISRSLVEWVAELAEHSFPVRRPTL